MAAIGTLPVLFATGIHASRPAASAVGKGGLYSCTTHSLIYQTDGSSWSTWATLTGTGLSDPMTTRGDIIVRNSSNATARLPIGSTGKVLQSDGTDISWQTPAAGGSTYGQSLAYPSSFTGDNDNFASLANWADVSAFDVAEILNSTVGHLVTKGASKDQKKRFTLGTTKAAAFDFRWTGVMPDIMYWSTAGDVYVDLALKTSADAHIVGWRLLPQLGFGAGSGGVGDCYVLPVVGGSVITAVTTTRIPQGAAVTLRITRDGSNNAAWYVGMGTAPVALARIKDTATEVPYNGTPSGTVARSEILIHTPSGPGSTAEYGMYIDAFESV